MHCRVAGCGGGSFRGGGAGRATHAQVEVVVRSRGVRVESCRTCALVHRHMLQVPCQACHEEEHMMLILRCLTSLGYEWKSI
eukprot:6652791-Pyramimonas_sp.AAC.1